MKYLKRDFFVVPTLLLMLSLVVKPVYAQTCTSNGNPGIDSAIGCITFSNPSMLTAYLLRWVLGIAGGISFLLIIYSGIMILTSQGDKKRLIAGKELLTAAFSGLLMVIFSGLLLNVLGVQILQIF